MGNYIRYIHRKVITKDSNQSCCPVIGFFLVDTFMHANFYANTNIISRSPGMKSSFAYRHLLDDDLIVNGIMPGNPNITAVDGIETFGSYKFGMCFGISAFNGIGSVVNRNFLNIDRGARAIGAAFWNEFCD